jgi:hypothetical protein
MRTPIKLLSLAVLCMLMTGCAGEQEAREYAGQLAAILSNYQNNVDRHIRAQMAAYEQLSRELDDAAIRDAQRSSETEREQRTVQLSDQLLSASPGEFSAFTRTRLREALGDFADREFEKNREMVTRDLDSYRRFLLGTQDLARESADVSQLETQFSDLSRKSGAVDQIKRLAAFGQDVKDKYGKLLCDGSKAEQKDLQDNIAALDKKLTDPGTSASDKPALTAEKTKAQGALQLVNNRLSSCSQ